MASKTMIMVVLLWILSCQTLVSFAMSSSSGGLSLELISPYSPKSPLFTANLTFAERHKRVAQQSRARIQHLAAIASSSASCNASAESLQPDTVVPIIEQKFQGGFLVKIGIGTFHAVPPAETWKSYYLVLDTASSLVWTQCEECRLPGNHCYPQMDAPFPNTQSKTYRPLLCKDHPLCKPKCIGGYCSYEEGYADNSNSIGILATETFSFPSSSSSKYESIPGIVFGCGLKNFDPHAETYPVPGYPVEGIFGLGQSDYSFVKQIESQSGGRFSYCLTNQNPTMHLRFGADIVPPRALQRMRYYKYGDSPAYFVNLHDLGINKERLGIRPSVIAPHGDNKGACLVDSGAAYSFIIKGAYDILVQGLVKYFMGFPEFVRVGDTQGRLCYRRERIIGYAKVPSVSFFFDSAQLDASPEGTFDRELESGKEIFCLTINSNEDFTTVGASQQVNHKLIYDTNSKQIQFGPEDCARNG